MMIATTLKSNRFISLSLQGQFSESESYGRQHAVLERPNAIPTPTVPGQFA
jgi:hypothetical protein